ncbi:hypothetical protein AB0387_20530 [Streptomyces sp. NPDC089173]|uniref:hypothetical protein n=1 Tax=Streptomyces sp. NPDC089173 TaxID=3154965 RepID=UPI0034508AEB
MFTSLTPRTAPPTDPLAVSATHMPFMTLTTGERGLHVPPLKTGADGWLTYRDPSPYDRYPGFDVLLMRTVGSPSGRPVGAQVSPYRQALCMVELACQGCRRPAARNEQGHPLFVLPRWRADGRTAYSAQGLTDMPPSCARCALGWCPVLKDRGRQLLWAGRAELVGVYGSLFVPGTTGVLEEQYVELAEDEDEGDDAEEERAPGDGAGGERARPNLVSAVVAERFVRDLQGVTPADPDQVRKLAAQQDRAATLVLPASAPAGRP